LLTIPLIALANKVEKVEINPNSPDVNTELSVKLNFTTPDDKVQCGVGIDWGDGDKQKLRVGNGQQVTPPFVLTHIYKSAGQKQIAVKGEFIARGLSSISGCEVNLSGSITVQDPVARAEKERVEKERQAELERQEQLNAQKAKEREEYLSTPAGKKELESSIKNFEKLFDKPLATNCATNDFNAIVFKRGSKDSGAKVLNFFGEKPPLELLITRSGLVARDIISIANTGDVTVEYKFTDKSIQIFNSKFVTNGIYNSNNNPTPIYSTCDSKTIVARIVSDELSGVAEKRRQVAAAKAESEAKAREEAKPYFELYMCAAPSGYGNDVPVGKSMFQRLGQISGNINVREIDSIISIFGYDKEKNNSGAFCVASGASWKYSEFNKLAGAIKVSEGGDKEFFMQKDNKYNSRFFYRMK